VRIGIVCDDDNKKKAAMFWKDHVQPSLEEER